MNQAYLKNILSAKFDFDIWKDLLEKIFPKVEVFTSVAKIADSHVKDGGHVGNIRLDDGRSLAIFRFEVSDNVQISRNRKSLRDIAAKYVDQGLIHGALVFYYSQNQDDYRLTFIAKQTYFNESGELVKKETAPKRYTFLLGKNEPCTTAASRLIELANKKNYGSIYLTDVTDAFSVERLNKEFFNGYKAQYKKFVDTLSDTKQHRDYVKKLLGRLVFLQFLQKKGWMGVPASNAKWEGGDKNYLSKLVDNYANNNRLLSDVLELLFFKTLNEKRNGDIADGKLGENIKIPYLNGGLFDKDKIDELDIDFPYSYFKDLMDFFSQYNFTIDENDPDDSEVGIDPEMLGHIFENLLEDNKDKGAFYTPKEIVQYMCRQSVIQYLKTHEPSELYAEPIEQLINNGVVNPILQSKNIAIRFTQLLKEVKVCDPAIGSGAFPMGILYVLYHAIHHLHSHAEPHGNFDSTQTKRDIIQNNIFGVDIEQGAVDIARLRFWLALVVDADKPQPLPNLDYKITCGNSQIYRYALDMPIADVFEEYNRVGKENARKEKSIWNKFTLEDYKRLVVGYTEEHTDKVGLKAKINDIKNCFKTTLAQGDIRQRQLAEQRVYEYEAIPLFGKRKAEEDPIGYAVAKSKLNKLIEKEHEILNNKKYEKSFEWRFEYPQLLDDKGTFIGFDIIIANPPYIKEGRMSKTFFEPYKDSPYYKGKMDIWYLFACNGLDLLNPNGVLCFIATNNWTTSFGASKLRDKVIKETRICNIVDFGAVMMFESASIQTMIMMFQKDKVTDDYTFDYRRLTAYKATEKEAIAILEPSYKTYEQAECYTPTIRRANFYDKNITFSQSSDILGVISSLSSVIYLNDKEIAQGIVFPQDTLNKKNQQKLGPQFEINQGIFVLTSAELETLALNQNELSLIKPYYTNENISRYGVQKGNKYWTIYTDSRYKNPNSLDCFPNIKRHLDRFVSVFTSDNKPYGLHRAREERFFVNNKVIAVRKCVGHPIFSYCDIECYLSQTFNMIQTDRVNLKYLTGLLNSKLIEFWLKNKGKMQGANYQLDKEPLQQIPIAEPAVNIQKLIATLVDYIILICSTKDSLSELVSNETIASFFEKIIDGCVYELYFEEHMKEQEINIIDSAMELIKPITHLSSDKEKADMILDVFMNIKKTDNSIRNRLDLFTLRSPEILKLIIEG
ncbi:Eco57I restriction-modification methylase domain-containing protein [Parabacteroides sp.]|uniref:Eco57I restriction-modification methylase domain-containing protein n=1 Tax=Parabacteroides sp. TaxID=1869337 RepID=UPI003FEFBC73